MSEAVDEKQKCFCPLQRIFVSWLKSDKLFTLEMPGVTGVTEITLHGPKKSWRFCSSAWWWLKNAKLRYCSLHKIWEKQLLSCQFTSLSLQSFAASHWLQSGEVIWCDLTLWWVSGDSSLEIFKFSVRASSLLAASALNIRQVKNVRLQYYRGVLMMKQNQAQKTPAVLLEFN